MTETVNDGEFDSTEEVIYDLPAEQPVVQPDAVPHPKTVRVVVLEHFRYKFREYFRDVEATMPWEHAQVCIERGKVRLV